MESLRTFLFVILLVLSYTSPVIITIFNVINLVRKEPLKEKLIDIATFILGIPLSVIVFWDWRPLDYTVPIVLDGMSFKFHSPLAFGYLPTLVTLLVLAVMGYAVLRIMKNRISPIVSILCISSIYIGMALSAVFLIQLITIISDTGIVLGDVFYMTLFPLNYILCSIRLIKQVVKLYNEQQKVNEIIYKNGLLQFCQRVLAESIGWYIAAFILMIPLLCILINILISFGQRPDAAIRAFTETSDWTLSQKVSPPPIEYDGHYLCTVAVNGHTNFVKPTRDGIRHGVKITVNRQLCIANAFEQLIEERIPKFHQIVRRIYDTCGYPISKHITTPIRADIVYTIMKPLEWLFLIMLYTCDKNPENRIAMQYTGKSLKNI